ncbi:hypothetical protein ES702_02635 [subsurface metagenome]
MGRLGRWLLHLPVREMEQRNMGLVLMLFSNMDETYPESGAELDLWTSSPNTLSSCHRQNRVSQMIWFVPDVQMACRSVNCVLCEAVLSAPSSSDNRHVLVIYSVVSPVREWPRSFDGDAPWRPVVVGYTKPPPHLLKIPMPAKTQLTQLQSQTTC